MKRFTPEQILVAYCVTVFCASLTLAAWLGH